MRAIGVPFVVLAQTRLAQAWRKGQNPCAVAGQGRLPRRKMRPTWKLVRGTQT